MFLSFHLILFFSAKQERYVFHATRRKLDSDKTALQNTTAPYVIFRGKRSPYGDPRRPYVGTYSSHNKRTLFHASSLIVNGS